MYGSKSEAKTVCGKTNKIKKASSNVLIFISFSPPFILIYYTTPEWLRLERDNSFRALAGHDLAGNQQYS